jgi:hypothetical protein
MPKTDENKPTVATVFTSSPPKRYLSVMKREIFHPAHNHIINIRGPQNDPITKKQKIKYTTINNPIS